MDQSGTLESSFRRRCSAVEVRKYLKINKDILHAPLPTESPFAR